MIIEFKFRFDPYQKKKIRFDYLFEYKFKANHKVCFVLRLLSVFRFMWQFLFYMCWL